MTKKERETEEALFSAALEALPPGKRLSEGDMTKVLPRIGEPNQFFLTEEQKKIYKARRARARKFLDKVAADPNSRLMRMGLNQLDRHITWQTKRNEGKKA